MKPTVGRVVHYVSHGSPVLPDGTQTFKPECRAAIVTAVHPSEGAGTLEDANGPELVALAVLNPPPGCSSTRAADIPRARRTAGPGTGPSARARLRHCKICQQPLDDCWCGDDDVNLDDGYSLWSLADIAGDLGHVPGDPVDDLAVDAPDFQ